jgi:hypothetical protein
MLDWKTEGRIFMTIYRVGGRETAPSIRYEPHSINLNREDMKSV